METLWTCVFPNKYDMLDHNFRCKLTCHICLEKHKSTKSPFCIVSAKRWNYIEQQHDSCKRERYIIEVCYFELCLHCFVSFIVPLGLCNLSLVGAHKMFKIFSNSLPNNFFDIVFPPINARKFREHQYKVHLAMYCVTSS